MPQLTISVTIDVPDDRDELSRVLMLLRSADNQVAVHAQEKIASLSSHLEILDEALPPLERTAKYIEAVRHYQDTIHSWMRSRDVAQKITFGAIDQLIQYRTEHMGEKKVAG